MADNPRRDALLSWYDLHGRDLPWRRTRDPYAIWVSEIMAQQTRIDTVVPYWERFMDRFPTPGDLARASEDEVMALWSGLGYYRRARLLHAGAAEVVESYGGQVPEGAEERLSLPGVGRYTAGAIGSIAFGLEEPVVDGNVARVLARLEGIDTPLGQARTERRLWTEAEALVVGPRPGDLNQALMELGARVCTPASPRCDECPLSTACHARAEGRQGELPVPRPKKAPKPVQLTAVVATRGRAGRTWLVRTEGTLFGGLWSLPVVEGHGRSTARMALQRAGITARLGQRPLGTVEHVLSHRLLEVEVWRATAARATATDGRRHLTPEELQQVGTSSLTHKLLALAP